MKYATFLKVLTAICSVTLPFPCEDVLELHLIRHDNVSLVEVD